MGYDFDFAPDRHDTSCAKWDLVERLYGHRDVIPLWVADMDFLAPQPVIEALQRRVHHGVYGYPVIPESVHDAVIAWMQERHGWTVKREWLVYTPGVVPALSLALQAYTHPGDKVIVQSPVYHPFFHVIHHNGRQLVDNELVYADGRYSMDFDGLTRAFDRRVKALFLCSPQNPTGRVWTEAELRRLAALCREHDVLVVSDEIHSDLVFSGCRHTPFGALSEDVAQSSITCIAPSKTFNLAGLKASVAIIPNKRLRDDFLVAMERWGLGGLNVFGLTAMEAAYRSGGEWLDQLLGYLEDNRDFLEAYCAERIPRIKAVHTEGTYLAWLDCRDLGLDQAGLDDLMTNKARVGLNSGTMFGPGGEGFQRLNFGCPRALLAEALRRIELAVNNLMGC